MKLSKWKLIAFFGVLALLLWALYPRGLLLGYIYEGLADLTRSEQFYLDYLQKDPTDKSAILRLAAIYDRKGEPEKGIVWLERLYNHRTTDAEVGMEWLNHLENSHDEEALYDGRLKVARNLMQAPHPPTEIIENLLSAALAQARWHQKPEDMERILADLLIIGRDKTPYREELRHLFRNTQQADKLVASLERHLKQSPDNFDILEELVIIYMTIGRNEDAEQLIAEGLSKNPLSPTLLQLQIDLMAREHQYTQLVPTAQKALTLQIFSDAEREKIILALANALMKLHRFDEALHYYHSLLQQDRDVPENWIHVMDAMAALGQHREMLAMLHDYLDTFPEDTERRKLLAETYLYTLKDLSVVSLYRSYIQETGRADFATDVGFAFADAKILDAAIAWITDMHVLFPHNTQMVQSLAEWTTSLRRTDDARRWYTLWASMLPNDMSVQLRAGTELLALADFETADKCLSRVTQADPQNADAWFWLSEIHAPTNMALAKDEASHVVAIFQSHPPHDAQHQWMLLHSRMRLKESPKTLLPEYAVAVAQYPNHPDLSADEIDLMIESRHLAAANKRISDYEMQFPKDGRRVQLMKARLAFAEKDWDTAIALLEPLANNSETQSNNEQWAIKRDLGEAYYQDGQWWKAMPLLEQVKAATGDRYQVADTLFFLHKNYDTRVTPLFTYTRFGNEYFTFGGVKFKDYITPDWEINAEAKEGYFASPSSNYSGYTETGSVTIESHHLRPWHMSFGVEGAVSSERATGSPTLTLEYKPNADNGVQLTGTYRKLRQDLPQAVAFGTLMDIAQIQEQTVLFERIITTARFMYERDYLPSGASAHGFTLEPTAQVILFKKPYVTLGWQMNYIRLNSSGNFLNSVPLIPYMNAQYVIGAISGRPVPNLLLEGGFYNGHDFDRGLSLLGGDLWGVRGGFDWAATSWLDIFGSYEFGRQRLLDIPGYSTFITFGLSGHW